MESERTTRKKRIDPFLQRNGWRVGPFDATTPLSSLQNCAIEEYLTDYGPADYSLCAYGRIIGVVEAKKLTLRAPDRRGYFHFNIPLSAYVELISYTKLLNDAKKRNQILFDKLHIRISKDDKLYQ